MAHLWVLSQGKKTKEEANIDQAWNFSKQLSNALRYLQDVVKKDILEQLPGASSILLEIVITGYTELRAYLINNEQSSVMISATNQMYNSLTELIKWSDVYIIHGDAALNRDGVDYFVNNLKEAVNTLIQLCVDRYKTRDQLIHSKKSLKNRTKAVQVNLLNGSNDSSQNEPHLVKLNQRNSLPDLSFTSQNLNYVNLVNYDSSQMPSIDCVSHSHSNESILPPKVEPYSNVLEASNFFTNHQFENKLFNLERRLSTSDVNTLNVSRDIPPPLPPKKRSLISHNPNELPSPSKVSHDASCQSQGSSIDSFLTISPSHNFYSADDLLASNKMPCTKFYSFQNKTELTHLAKQSDALNSKLQHSQFCFNQEYFRSHFSSPDNSKMATYHSNKIEETTQKLKEFKLEKDEFLTSVLPQIPVKLRNKSSTAQNQNRPPSFYDNICDTSSELTSSSVSNDSAIDSQNSSPAWLSSNHSLSSSNHSSNQTSNTNCPVTQSEGKVKPPPLPPKKKNIMAYMQMMGSYYGPNDAALNLYRHSVHTFHVINSPKKSSILQQLELSFMQQKAFSQKFLSSNALKADESESVMPSETEIIQLTIPFDFEGTSNAPILSPKKKICPSQSVKPGANLEVSQSQTNSLNSSVPSSESGIDSQSGSIKTEPDEIVVEGPLDEIDVKSYLIYKSPNEDGPEIRGGSVDALIVKAAEVSKNDFVFQEAFLTTYRTFITPSNLIHKLLFRYNKFINFADIRQRAAKNSFALMVRVVDEFSIGDCSDNLMQTLLEFIYQLVSKGDLALARVLRSKVIEKLEARRAFYNLGPQLLPSMNISSKTWNLHDFKPELISEQMTLLDSELFDKIEVAEVLLWVREQKEDQIPNLNKFTEHFNKMSYWTRSRIIELEDGKDREKSMIKFIKIMKQLRKLNNFNSYLAILSALSSGPIRRLDWNKSIIDALEEFCSLIDSSSSFRAYRQVLAETQPPCIPYIGLILQDLTFVNIGNSDYLKDKNTVNFAKRWQIFNILNQIKRFRKSHYPFKKKDQIIDYFNNFDNYLSEEAIWQISETIKPRAVTKK